MGIWGKKNTATASTPVPQQAQRQAPRAPPRIVTWYTPQLPEEAVVDIVFVHGLRGSIEQTWRDDTGVCWPETLLPRQVPNARIIAFGYEANAISVPTTSDRTDLNTVRGHGNALMRAVGELRQRDENPKPLIFVGHSLGGLVIQEAWLASRSQIDPTYLDIAKSTRGTIFLGTPMQGSEYADFAGGLARALFFMDVNHNIIGLLRTDSEKCFDMQRDFHLQITQCREGGGYYPGVSCFYEQYAMRRMNSPVVTERSATSPGWPSAQLQGDHVEMAKCLSTMPQNFRTLSDLLWSWVNRASRGELVDTGVRPRNRGTPGDFRGQEVPAPAAQPSRAVPALLQDRAYGRYIHNQSIINAPTSGHNVHQGFVFNTRSRHGHVSDDDDEE